MSFNLAAAPLLQSVVNNRTPVCVDRVGVLIC